MPVGEIGIAAGSGGALTVLLWKLVPAVIKAVGGNGKPNGNGKPGKAEVCIKRGLMVKEHDVIIRELCASREAQAKQAETARKEIRDDFKSIHEKLDNMKQ